MDVKMIKDAFESIGWMALVVYIDCAKFRIPQSRNRQITYAFNIKRVQEVYGLTHEGAVDFIATVFSQIQDTLRAVLAVFEAMPMVPIESFMFERSHDAVSRCYGYWESQTRSYDCGFKWKGGPHKKTHPEFFKRFPTVLNYDCLDTQNSAIPYETRHSRTYAFLTQRERSVTGAIATLLQRYKSHAGEAISTVSPERR